MTVNAARQTFMKGFLTGTALTTMALASRFEEKVRLSRQKHDDRTTHVTLLVNCLQSDFSGTFYKFALGKCKEIIMMKH